MAGGSARKRLRKLFFVEDFIERDVRLALVLSFEALVKSVQTPSLGILLDLLIPGIGIEVREPGAQFGEIVSRKSGDGTLDFFDRAHAGKILPANFRASAETSCLRKLIHSRRWTVMMLQVPAMQLHDQLAARDEQFIVICAVTATAINHKMGQRFCMD